MDAEGAHSDVLKKFAFLGDWNSIVKDLAPGTVDFFFHSALLSLQEGNIERAEEQLRQLSLTSGGGPKAKELEPRVRLAQWGRSPADTDQVLNYINKLKVLEEAEAEGNAEKKGATEGWGPSPETWADVSRRGQPDEVLAYLRSTSILDINLSEVAWRIQDPAFFPSALSILRERHANPTPFDPPPRRDAAPPNAPLPTTPHPPPPPNTTRALANVETISSLRDIPGADQIVAARVRGWDVVVRRSEFSVGDSCVFFEVDSLLDVADARFAHLAERGVRTDALGHVGHVLKTAKLRGQISQGLALPLSAFPELAEGECEVGEDVSARLRVVKWEAPIPAALQGSVRGTRPEWIPMTEELRVQNMAEILDATGLEGQVLSWMATEKIDGMSTTFYVDAGADVGVCTRNMDVRETQENDMWRIARQLDIFARLAAEYPGARVALQGETYGAGIQGNALKLADKRFAAFTLLVAGQEIPRAAWPAWVSDMSVPLRPELTFPSTLDRALSDVDGLRSLFKKDRPAEGVVWRCPDNALARLPDGRVTRASFKVISNRYLLKNDR